MEYSKQNKFNINHLNKLRDMCKYLKNILEKAKYSSENYDSSREPFFNRNKSFNLDEIDKTKELKDINQLSLPFELNTIFKIIGNNNLECYLDYWTIMSLEKIKNRYNLMKEEYKKDNIIDFAFMYIGMGHILVAAIDTKDKQVFIRRDGGSNYYDREYNLKFIIDYEPKIEDKISFSNWLLSINKPELLKTVN